MTGDPRPATGGWFARTFPVPAPAWVAPGISTALVVGAAGRAQDYLTRHQPPPGGRGRLTELGVEVAGFTVWGGLWLALAGLLTAGVLVLISTRSRWAVLLAHAAAVALHLSYVLALLPGVPGSGRGLGVVGPPLAAGLIHVLCVGLYIGPRPRRR